MGKKKKPRTPRTLNTNNNTAGGTAAVGVRKLMRNLGRAIALVLGGTAYSALNEKCVQTRKTKKATVEDYLRDGIKVGIAIIAGIGFTYCMLQLQGLILRKKLKQIEAHEGVANCVVKKSGNMKGNYVIAEFYYKGHRYEINEGAYGPDVVRGENFPVSFDTTDPMTAEIQFDKPFFRPDQTTSFLSGVVVQVNSRTVRFEYTVGDKHFKKFQERKEGSVFNEGETYTVEYLIMDPRHAILNYQ